MHTKLAVLLCLLAASCTTADTSEPAPMQTAAPTANASSSPVPRATSAPARSSPSISSRPDSAALDSSRFGPPGEVGTLQKYLFFLGKDVNGYWKATFTADGDPWVDAVLHLVQPQQVIASGCEAVAGNPKAFPDASPAFFCPGDNGVYLDLSWVREAVWGTHLDEKGGLQRGGDLAAAVVVGHEIAHSVQKRRRQTNSGWARPTELQADCLAGVWARSKRSLGALPESLIVQAIDLTHEVGDYESGAPGHHGTPAERTAAFRAGYDSGDEQDCPLDVGAQ